MQFGPPPPPPPKLLNPFSVDFPFPRSEYTKLGVLGPFPFFLGILIKFSRRQIMEALFDPAEAET